MFTAIMDFFADYGQEAQRWLDGAGYRVRPPETVEDAIVKYLNAAKRRISARPRTVLLSNEFQIPLGYEQSVKELLRKIEEGEDLVPHQSRFIFQSEKQDALLNDWDIHHLHLGNGVDPKDHRLIEGTKHLLFARLTEDTAYCINIAVHVFTLPHMVEVLHLNWPESIARFRVYGVPGENLSECDIKALRGANCNALISMSDGTTYWGMGGGYMSSGTSTEVMSGLVQIKRLCRNLESSVRDHLNKTNAVGNFKFNLRIQDGHFFAEDRSSGLTIAFLLEE